MTTWMVAHANAVLKLQKFVAGEYDGGVESNFELDRLLWEVRQAHPHNHPETPMVQPEFKLEP